MFMECSHLIGNKKISSVDFSFIHRAYFLCQADIRAIRSAIYLIRLNQTDKSPSDQ